MNRSWLLGAAALGCFALAACQPPPHLGEPDEVTARQLQHERELYPSDTATAATTLGRLEVFTTGLMTDGRNIKVRGKLHNPLSQPVEGVRLLFKIFRNNTNGEPDVLEKIQEEKALRIASGETEALRMDVQTMYAGGVGGTYGFFFGVEAYAKRVGDRDIAPPPGWKE